MYHVTNLNPINLGNDGQRLADLVLELLPKEGFTDPSEFHDNEGSLITEACKKDGWAFVPQSGGFDQEWEIDIRIGGSSESIGTPFRISENHLADLVCKYVGRKDLIVDFDDEGIYGILFPEVMKALEQGSDHYYQF